MDRLDRERQFHDQRFRDHDQDVRESVSKFYSVYVLNTACRDKLLSHHAPGADVLEYGCATGQEALRWAHAGARVKGVDISGEAVRIANERAQHEQLPAQFFVMNAEQLDFAGASFDVVFGEGILHHLELRKAYAEIARVLKPGGRAIFVEPLGHNPVFNFFRRRTPMLRTSDEHPLLMRDLKLMRSFFDEVNVRFFHLITLAAVPLRNTALFKPVLNVLHGLDRALMTVIPPLRAWAWIAVIEMVGPRRAGSR